MSLFGKSTPESTPAPVVAAPVIAGAPGAPVAPVAMSATAAPTVTHLGRFESPRHAAFALAAVEDLDGKWITPAKAASGQGYFIDITGEHRAELAQLYNEHRTVTLSDGTIRIRTATDQLAGIVKEGVEKRSVREGWSDTVALQSAIGSSALDCRDGARANGAAVTTGPELHIVAVKTRILDVFAVHNADGSLKEVRMVPVP